MKVLKNFTCIEAHNRMLWTLQKMLKVELPKSVLFSDNFKLFWNSH